MCVCVCVCDGVTIRKWGIVGDIGEESGGQ